MSNHLSFYSVRLAPLSVVRRLESNRLSTAVLFLAHNNRARFRHPLRVVGVFIFSILKFFLTLCDTNPHELLFAPYLNCGVSIEHRVY